MAALTQEQIDTYEAAHQAELNAARDWIAEYKTIFNSLIDANAPDQTALKINDDLPTGDVDLTNQATFQAFNNVVTAYGLMKDQEGLIPAEAKAQIETLIKIKGDLEQLARANIAQQPQAPAETTEAPPITMDDLFGLDFQHAIENLETALSNTQNRESTFHRSIVDIKPDNFYDTTTRLHTRALFLDAFKEYGASYYEDGKLLKYTEGDFNYSYILDKKGDIYSVQFGEDGEIVRDANDMPIRGDKMGNITDSFSDNIASANSFIITATLLKDISEKITLLDRTAETKQGRGYRQENNEAELAKVEAEQDKLIQQFFTQFPALKGFEDDFRARLSRSRGVDGEDFTSSKLSKDMKAAANNDGAFTDFIIQAFTLEQYKTSYDGTKSHVNATSDIMAAASHLFHTMSGESFNRDAIATHRAEYGVVSDNILALGAYETLENVADGMPVDIRVLYYPDEQLQKEVTAYFGEETAIVTPEQIYDYVQYQLDLRAIAKFDPDISQADIDKMTRAEREDLIKTDLASDNSAIKKLSQGIYEGILVPDERDLRMAFKAFSKPSITDPEVMARIQDERKYGEYKYDAAQIIGSKKIPQEDLAAMMGLDINNDESREQYLSMGLNDKIALLQKHLDTPPEIMFDALKPDSKAFNAYMKLAQEFMSPSHMIALDTMSDEDLAIMTNTPNFAKLTYPEKAALLTPIMVAPLDVMIDKLEGTPAFPLYDRLILNTYGYAFANHAYSRNGELNSNDKDKWNGRYGDPSQDMLIKDYLFANGRNLNAEGFTDEGLALLRGPTGFGTNSSLTYEQAMDELSPQDQKTLETALNNMGRPSVYSFATRPANNKWFEEKRLDYHEALVDEKQRQALEAAENAQAEAALQAAAEAKLAEEKATKAKESADAEAAKAKAEADKIKSDPATDKDKGKETPDTGENATTDEDKPKGESAEVEDDDATPDTNKVEAEVAAEPSPYDLPAEYRIIRDNADINALTAKFGASVSDSVDQFGSADLLEDTKALEMLGILTRKDVENLHSIYTDHTAHLSTAAETKTKIQDFATTHNLSLVERDMITPNFAVEWFKDDPLSINDINNLQHRMDEEILIEQYIKIAENTGLPRIVPFANPEKSKQIDVPIGIAIRNPVILKEIQEQLKFNPTEDGTNTAASPEEIKMRTAGLEAIQTINDIASSAKFILTNNLETIPSQADYLLASGQLTEDGNDGLAALMQEYYSIIETATDKAEIGNYLNEALPKFVMDNHLNPIAAKNLFNEIGLPAIRIDSKILNETDIQRLEAMAEPQTIASRLEAILQTHSLPATIKVADKEIPIEEYVRSQASIDKFLEANKDSSDVASMKEGIIYINQLAIDANEAKVTLNQVAAPAEQSTTNDTTAKIKENSKDMFDQQHPGDMKTPLEHGMSVAP